MARKYKYIQKPTEYTIMWILVMFDLPVLTKTQMRKATQFRNNLLELGFIRKQFSVYLRPCENMAAAERMAEKVGLCLFGGGRSFRLFHHGQTVRTDKKLFRKKEKEK